MDKRSIDKTLEKFFPEMLAETFEGGELKAYMELPEEEKKKMEKREIQYIFQRVLYHTPEEYSYLDSVKDLFRDDTTLENPDLRYKLLRETFNKPYKKMVISKFNSEVGIDLENLPTNHMYMMASETFQETIKPSAVILQDIFEEEINLCRVYSLRDDTIREIRLTDLHPFKLDNYSKTTIEWEMEDIRRNLGRLEKTLKENQPTPHPLIP